jgi:glycosyltransferase involved in cell wall biosynthesis
MQHERVRSILYVAYPLLPVSDESAGGAEQILWLLEREMSRRGYETTVAACAGSRISGELFASGRAVDEPDRYEVREAEHCARTLQEVFRRGREGRGFDMVHDQSGSFWRHAGQLAVPVLATLHLPRSFYRPELFEQLAPNVFFNCVSESQAHAFREAAANTSDVQFLSRITGVVPNGIDLERFPLTESKSNYLLWMGRICEEKGAHVAIEVAAKAGLRLVLAGQVYPFSYHQKYCATYVRPHLSPRRGQSRVQFVESPTFPEKVELLRNARAVLLTSLCDETSSLVAMEALACGTPAVGFRRGAVPEIIADGRTGIIVDSVEAMAAAVRYVCLIRPRECRKRAERHFSAKRMADNYQRLYRQICAEWPARDLHAA